MLQKGLKQRIYKAVINEGDFIGNADGFAVINKVWDLRSMDSTDSRYKDGYGDFRQHMVNNDDWTIDEIFYDKLNLLDGDDDIFLGFLEAFVDAEIRTDIDFIISKVDAINTLLIEGGLVLKISSYLEDRPIFKVQTTDNKAPIPVDLKENKIVFYTNDEEYFSMPCFLISQSDWDDYSYRTTVKIEYLASTDFTIDFGYIKIMKKGLQTNEPIINLLPTSFTSLSDEYCSLSTEESYYYKLKEKFPNQFNSILLALKDAAMFPKIADLFEHDSAFRRSLTRDNSAEQVARLIRFQLAGVIGK